MAKNIDWIRLWRELVEVQSTEHTPGGKHKGSGATPERRWAKADSTVDFVIRQVQTVPEATVLDIGAGAGVWAIRLSPHVKRVTALDASSLMLQAARQNLDDAGVSNVDLLEGKWPEARVAPHDFSLCSHGMYGSPDLPTFIRRMEESTRRTCFLMLRAPSLDGVMAQAALRIWGHPYDSANFHVCYNALLQMGIFANVLMADSGWWSPWKNASLEEALAECKRRFGLAGPSEHDEFLMDLLRRHLAFEEGQYVWPRSVRSALIYWHPNF